MARLDELFAEQKFDEALTYYTHDFTGLYPGQTIIKDKKGKYSVSTKEATLCSQPLVPQVRI